MKNKLTYIAIFGCFFACLLAGCTSTSKTTTMECTYDITKTEIMKYTFELKDDTLNKLSVSFSGVYDGVEEEVFLSTVKAIEETAEKQSKYAGVKAVIESDKKKKSIEQSITVNIEKYDMDKDVLEIFGDTNLDEINEKYITEKYGDIGFTITKNGKKIK